LKACSQKLFGIFCLLIKTPPANPQSSSQNKFGKQKPLAAIPRLRFDKLRGQNSDLGVPLPCSRSTQILLRSVKILSSLPLSQEDNFYEGSKLS
jgi:hypothetical protein